MFKILGLNICKDTIVGDEMQRGVSGGQKKCVTTVHIILTTDNDPLGQALAEELARRLGRERLYILSFIFHVKQSKFKRIMRATQGMPQSFDVIMRATQDQHEAAEGVLLDDDLNEPTMGEKLASLSVLDGNKSRSDIEQESSIPTKPPSADSVHVLLKQALNADDRTLLLDCLFTQIEKVLFLSYFY
ncbi:hypothetical protein JHK82_043658 [Glycine max]|nr:hypothetical protein JHK86_043543 [Glycine max]KAG4957826.1 hypothetical protein JHK85_044206 [Glycine max]KAG5106688.1 hypothetical protein JHK82_043658 [Glycine max]KAG5117612.1 hypothetical protein JHK84_043725 [Glycine max]